MSFFLTSFEQGLIYAVLAMGVYISYKILDIADLTIEGSFAFGGFIYAKFMLLGYSPFSATLLAFVIGSLAGLFTAFLFCKLKITPLLAGILTMTILHSVNLRVVGKANIPLYDYPSIYSRLSFMPKFVSLIAIVVVIKLALDLFFKTEIGYLLIATGDNPKIVKAVGQHPDKFRVIGMMLSNALGAMSGALFCQDIGFVDISLSNSIIVTALASVIIGEAVIRSESWAKGTTKAIIGAILYKEIYGFAIHLGLEPTDLKGISALIVIGFLAYKQVNLPRLRRVQ